MAMSQPQDTAALLHEILASVKSLKLDQTQLADTVEAINGRVNILAGVKQSRDGIVHDAAVPSPKIPPMAASPNLQPMASSPRMIPKGHHPRESVHSIDGSGTQANGTSQSTSPPPRQSSNAHSKIVITTHPEQADPLPNHWGNADATKRGPVVVARSPSTIRRRNAIGAHGGSYSIYYALAVASQQLNTDHKPDYTNTEPAANIGPFPAWGDPKKIVAMDPFGHLAPWLYKDIIRDENVEIRPTIAVTRAHM